MATAGQRRAPAPSVAADSTAQAAMPTRWPASAPMLSPSERTSDLSSGSSSSPPARLAARVITGPRPGRAGRSAEPGAWGGDTGGGGGGLGEVIGGGAVRGGCLLGRLSGHLGDAGGGHHPWIDGGQRQRERTIGSGGIQHQPGRGRQGAGAVP